MAFKFTSFKEFISQWISSRTYQKSQDNLRLLMFTIFLKSCLAKIVFICRFKIQSGYIIKYNGNIIV